MTDLEKATEKLRKAMQQSIEKTAPALIKKGRTLYIVNQEARELQRIDRIFEGGGK